jgi:Fe-S cluster assembly ATPase SufC
MTDPVSGAAANSAQKVAENASASGVEEAGDKAGASFDDVLNDVQESQATEATEQAQATESVDGVDQVDQIQEVDGPAKTRLDDFVNQINTDQAEIERMLENGMGGGEMSQKDLLQVQALIYGHAQRVELTSKVVSNAAKGVKQVMNTQV